MEEPKPDVTRSMKREQCYLCFMTLVENPPLGIANRDDSESSAGLSDCWHMT